MTESCGMGGTYYQSLRRHRLIADESSPAPVRPRHRYLRALPVPGEVSKACQQGRHSNCAKLSCACPHHGRQL